MTRFANFSGKDVVNVLVRHFGFTIIGQRGSHIKVRALKNEEHITNIVPDHKELAPGTLRGILKQAKIFPEDFLAASGRK